MKQTMTKTETERRLAPEAGDTPDPGFFPGRVSLGSPVPSHSLTYKPTPRILRRGEGRRFAALRSRLSRPPRSPGPWLRRPGVLPGRLQGPPSRFPFGARFALLGVDFGAVLCYTGVVGGRRFLSRGGGGAGSLGGVSWSLCLVVPPVVRSCPPGSPARLALPLPSSPALGPSSPAPGLASLARAPGRRPLLSRLLSPPLSAPALASPSAAPVAPIWPRAWRCPLSRVLSRPSSPLALALGGRGPGPRSLGALSPSCAPWSLRAARPAPLPASWFLCPRPALWASSPAPLPSAVSALGPGPLRPSRPGWGSPSSSSLWLLPAASRPRFRRRGAPGFPRPPGARPGPAASFCLRWSPPRSRASSPSSPPLPSRPGPRGRGPRGNGPLPAAGHGDPKIGLPARSRRHFATGNSSRFGY